MHQFYKKGDIKKTEHATIGPQGTVYRQSAPDRGTWDWEQRAPLSCFAVINKTVLQLLAKQQANHSGYIN